MSRSTVNGLQSALRAYESDKVKERAEGASRLREIFSNKENLLSFDKTASRDGGAGWVALFQCLFQVVVLEKKGWLRKVNGGPQAERRLADAISLVRWMAERSVHLISRKPVQTLITHMTTLLVYSGALFAPAAIDYAKAIRSLLSYPPHLNELDPNTWRVLIGVCWSSVLGDEVSIDGDLDDDLLGGEDDSPVVPLPTQAPASIAKGRTSVTQATNELAQLIPLLLSSTAAPITPPLPVQGALYDYEQSLALSMLYKASRFYAQSQGETSLHLPMLRSTNYLLSALELNCRHDLVAAGMRLLPQLIDIWPTRNKAAREQVLIALRTILPFLVLKTTLEKDKLGVIRNSLERLMDILPKESITRWGFEAIDMSTVRLEIAPKGERYTEGRAFERRVLRAGFDFSHDAAMRWTVIELYSEVCYHLYHTIDPPHAITPSRDPTQSKRRKISDPLSNLVSATRHGAYGSRVQATQTIIFLIDSHWDDVHLELQTDIRQQMLALLDEDEPSLQSWAFIGIATLATLPSPTTSSTDLEALIPSTATQARALSVEGDFARAWTYAVQKTALAGVYRPACLAAHALLVHGKVEATTVIKDIGFLLEGVDIRGPPFPFESVCALLDQALSLARHDVRLYSMGLEAKVISWLAKWNAVDGSRGKGRLDQHTPSDILPLLCNAAHLQAPPFHRPTTLDFLPDCAIVERVLEEERTRPIRQFSLYGKIIDARNSDHTAQSKFSMPEGDSSSAAFLDGSPRRISDILTALIDAFCQSWPAGSEGEARPAIPADRCRRTVDMLVLALSFQATLQANGIRCDNACLQSSIRLLDLITPVLKSPAYDIISQNLMWKGLEPLIQGPVRPSAEIWTVLLRPTGISGVRGDLLPKDGQDAEEGEEADREDDFLVLLWQLPSLAGAFAGLVDASLSLFARSDSATQDTSQPNGTARDDDDDFGEIRIAESDAIPVSQEASECQRTTSSYLSMLARFRLRHASLTSAHHMAVADKKLLNAFLGSDGPRFVQLGMVICETIRRGHLRLAPNAADLVIERLEELTRAYIYRNHEGLLRMVLAFMTGSVSIWLAPKGDKFELSQRVLHIAKTLYLRTTRKSLPSWRVRLDLVLFIDEYLDYEPEQKAWQNYSDSQMDTDDSDLLATDVIAAALTDVDTRVRFRAASSTAGILFLSSLAPERHRDLYEQCVMAQPREPKHWDAFITDILFKLNCCITSPQVRAPTLYHLCEVSLSSHDYDHHIEAGLTTVARRLGLSGIAPLSLAHLTLIFTSQIAAGQKPMRVSHKLYGFPSRKTFALNALDSTGPSLLLSALAEKVRSDPGVTAYVGASDLLSGLCGAAGVNLVDVIHRHFSAAAAQLLCDPYSAPYVTTPAPPAQAVAYIKRLANLAESNGTDDPMLGSVEEIITHLFLLVDLSYTDKEISDLLSTDFAHIPRAADVYRQLLSIRIPSAATSLALVPSASAKDVMSALIFLATTYTQISSAKVLFNTLTRLFHRINDDFLISEQYRHLRGIALAISLYGNDLSHPAILGCLLRESLPLLTQREIAPAVLAILRYGFSLLDRAPKPPDDLDQLIIALGSTRDALTDEPANAALVQALDAWIMDQAPSWQQVDVMRPALTVARSTWPGHLAESLDKVGNPSFIEICDNAEKVETADVVPMCDAMVKSLVNDTSRTKEYLERFQRGAFWHIKRQLQPSPRNIGSISAFVDLLFAGHGQVHPPGLESAALGPGIEWLQQVFSRKDAHPSRGLRTMMVDRIVMMARLPAYKARTSALSTLQMLLWCINDAKASKAAEGTERSAMLATNDLLALLTPAPPPPCATTALDFGILASDETWLKRARDAAMWSSALATFIASALSVRERFYAALPDLFAAIPSAAADLLPLLVQASLAVDAEQRADLKERHTAYTKHFTSVLASPLSGIETLRTIVDVMLHLRHFSPPYKRSDELAFDRWLEINPMLISEAALKCGNYATALMYLENVRVDANDEKSRRTVDLFDKHVQQIMYESYSNVEDPDGFYGIQTHDVFDHLHRRVQHEGDHWRSFGLHSAVLESGLDARETASTSLLAMRDLHNLGFNQVSNSIFASLKSSTDKTTTSSTDPLLFELAWRTSDWDLPLPSQASSDTLLYSALRAVHRERDLSIAVGVVDKAMGLEVSVLRDCGVERMGAIKKSVTNLICLNEVKKWLEVGEQGGDDKAAVENGWGRVVHLNEAFAFADAERVMATRRSLISATKAREAPQVFGDLHTPRLSMLHTLDVQALLRTGQLARAEGNVQASINALVSATKLESSLGTATEAVQDEFAQVLWAQNEPMLAIQHVDVQVKQAKAIGTAGGRLAVLMGRMAHWTSRAKSRAPPDIRSIFEEATKLAEVHKLSAVEVGELFHNLAIFADSHQQDLSRSPEIEKLNSTRIYRDSEGGASTPVPTKRSAKSSARTTEVYEQLEREMREDEEAVEAILQERSRYARLALTSFAKSLAFTDKYDDSTTRMVSLWLEFDGDNDVNEAFQSPLKRVPTYKFIFLSPQLSARLYKSRSHTPFNDALNPLVLRISQHHPFHILYQVLTLADGFQRTIPKGKRAVDHFDEGRAASAHAILLNLSVDVQANALARRVTPGMSKLADAASRWCLTRTREEESATPGRAMNVPLDCPLKLLPPDLRISIATAPPPIDPLCTYAHIPTLVRYRSQYAVLGGIHRPKRMQVIDTSGRTYRELFKGEDELRQDAVMEQVFEMSNTLLKRDRKTRERDLRFRTYVVIPLANKTGIMEFVGDSQAIGDWLKPAHKKYGRAIGDLEADEFRKNLRPLQEKEKNWNLLPAKYNDLMSSFHPVMRHFFTEKHRDPMAWFTMRLNYTRSVAVTSIIGWILGVGDRHCSNILIDQKTGELVHIDFGIVFEDGRRLRIPEKVPFRLTPDLVDGFGLMGVDGTFRRCSEHTLRVLRESSEVIMTVLEVFKHDPLYAWDADPEKLQRAQGGGKVAAGSTTSASALEKADRILSKIRGKLRPDLSIEYTVNQLIQEARDVENLAKIFVGWQPWF